MLAFTFEGIGHLFMGSYSPIMALLYHFHVIPNSSEATLHHELKLKVIEIIEVHNIVYCSMCIVGVGKRMDLHVTQPVFVATNSHHEKLINKSKILLMNFFSSTY